MGILITFILILILLRRRKKTTSQINPQAVPQQAQQVGPSVTPSSSGLQSNSI
jgi:hypothetical protein